MKTPIFRLPNLVDAKNEVVQWAGIAVAFLTWLTTFLGNADFSTREGVIAAASVLMTNIASGRVWSSGSVQEMQGDA